MKIFTIVFLVTVMVLLSITPAQANTNVSACWGQASAVFAQMGVMGEHSSQEPTPRVGLANLARLLYEQELIDDDSMTALGQFVADAYGLSIEACLP